MICDCEHHEGSLDIGRRKLLVAVGGAAAAWPVKTWSQGPTKKRQRIGWLSGSSSKLVNSFADKFLDGMRIRILKWEK
jgi:hypothetical protein